MEKKDTPAMKQALIELFDTDETKVMKALSKFKRDGRARHFPALTSLLADAPNPIWSALLANLDDI